MSLRISPLRQRHDRRKPKSPQQSHRKFAGMEMLPAHFQQSERLAHGCEQGARKLERYFRHVRYRVFAVFILAVPVAPRL